ncbi:ribbon-helix-helix protein, CopG family [Microbacterium gorillae]|uniref:ribbon-helix-helix protein, CopG family n=1 Tax=Microbacterium gorillae TaxID=1231063 RepID=UPI00058B71D6|nr:ribbon-helix-helix protein, CopG family [Microbacterium gorillae]
MEGDERINGEAVTEEHIAAWSAEAEAGFDIDAIKKRGRGRPGRGSDPAQVVALRLTAEELAALDARAAREHKSRSELIREAIAAFAS